MVKDKKIADMEQIRKQTLKEVGEWLANHPAYTAMVSESNIQLPFLQPLDYERLYRALKRGELPE